MSEILCTQCIHRYCVHSIPECLTSDVITSLFLTVLTSEYCVNHHRSQSLSLSWIQSLMNCTHACQRPDKYSELMIITNCPRVYISITSFMLCCCYIVTIPNYSQWDHAPLLTVGIRGLTIDLDLWFCPPQPGSHQVTILLCMGALAWYNGGKTTWSRMWGSISLL